MKNAQKKYEEISGGIWLDDGPEYFLTSQLAIHLNKEMQILCTLEEPMVSFPLGRGAPGRRLRRNGKADIAMWTNDEQVVAIVEVKNNVYHSSCEDDLHRLANFSRRVAGSPLSSFAFFQSAWGLSEDACSQILDQATLNLMAMTERTVDHYQLQIEHHCFASKPEQYDDELFYGFLAHASTFSLGD
jgi:hypothetical protein